MTAFEEKDVDSPLGEASAWIARLQGDGLTEADGLAFDAWLDASPENRAAYAAALATWHEFEGAAPQILRALDEADRPRRVRSPARPWFVAAGAIAAAVIMALVLLPQVLTPPRAQAYATARGQHLGVKLADGSTIDMNAETRLAVTLARHERRVVMGEGEAIFDVAADARRPFEIEAAGRVVRVVGTQFDVRNRPDGLAVVVARGVVQVRGGSDAGRTYVLHPGQRLDFNPAGATRVSVADPAESFGWRIGRLVYRDEPLANVVADLNRQFPSPIRIDDPRLGQSRISGVLILDNQADVLQRLALMLPVKAVRSDRDVLLQPR